MWADILLSAGTSVCEALCLEQIEKANIEEHRRHINTILHDLLERFADSSLDTPEFHAFISSSSFKNHVRLMYSTIYGNDQAIESYRTNFANLITENVPGTLFNEVYDFVTQLCDLYENYLCALLKKSPALDALFQLIIKANREIMIKVMDDNQKMRQFLSSFQSKNIKITNDDIKTYHSVSEQEFRYMRFSGIHSAENRPLRNIQDLYVENSFSYCTTNLHIQFCDRIKRIFDIRLANFFDFGNKIVLLGGAGLGKTTTLNYLYCNYESLFNSCGLKIKIDLKDYAKAISEDNKDILWCITNDFTKKIQRIDAKQTTIETLISELLRKGDCLIIFDALDEITTQDVRDKVRNQIAIFTDLYYLNRFIISSRESGYLRNRFDESFLHIRVNEFSPRQVEAYSQKWFHANYADKKFDEFWKNFYSEVKRARCIQLISNPIILILALLIFDAKRNLPNKRVLFYKYCIETFLELREISKNVWKFTDKERDILADDLIIPKVASYKLERVDRDQDYKLTDDELDAALLDAIEVEDKAYWRAATRHFKKYLIERTELICEVDEGVFDFSHKTFYEYFSAVYYAKVYSIDNLLHLLEQWIGDANYDELAKLIIEVIIQNNQPHQHGRVIEFLFSKCKEHYYDLYPYVSDSYFSILANLYRHNMLIPKYHQSYNECILYYPRLARAINRFSYHIEKPNPEIKFDVATLAKMYHKAVKQNNQYEETLDALYYLGQEFRNHTKALIDDRNHIHLTALFKEVSLTQRGTVELNHEITYFTQKEGLELTLRYPQIFLAVLSGMIKSHNFKFINQLVNVTFAPNNYLHYYIPQRLLSTLLKLPIQTPEMLATLLIALIDCNTNHTNQTLHQLSLISINKRSRKQVQMINNLYYIWYILNNSMSFSEFMFHLKSYPFYHSQYEQDLESLFERLFNNYSCLEKMRKDDILREYMDRYMRPKATIEFSDYHPNTKSD